MSFWKPALAPAAAASGAAGQGILFRTSAVLDIEKDSSGMTTWFTEYLRFRNVIHVNLKTIYPARIL
jgi:hypothetical protein